jgi:hypothetical protein
VEVRATTVALADFLLVLRDPLSRGVKGGLDLEYIAGRMGRSVRTVERYRRMVREEHPDVAQAKTLIGG